MLLEEKIAAEVERLTNNPSTFVKNEEKARHYSQNIKEKRYDKI